MFQFGGGRNCIIFTKIKTKLRQKLKYKDQIVNEKMTPLIIVTRGTITATWHDVSLTHDKFVFFLNFKKIYKK